MLLMERYYFYLKDYSTRLFQLLEWGEGNGDFHLKAKLQHSRAALEKPQWLLSVRIYNAPKGCFGIIVSFSDLPEWLNHYNQVVIRHLKSFSHTHSVTSHSHSFFLNFSKFSWAWSWWLRLLPYSTDLCDWAYFNKSLVFHHSGFRLLKFLVRLEMESMWG